MDGRDVIFAAPHGRARGIDRGGPFEGGRKVHLGTFDPTACDHDALRTFVAELGAR